MKGEHLDLTDFYIRNLIARAELTTEADNASCVVPGSKRVETHVAFWQQVECLRVKERG